MTSSNDHLRLSADSYRRFFDRLPLLCVVVRPDGTIASCNARFAESHGLPKSAIEGGGIGDLLSDNDRLLVRRYLDAAIDGAPVPLQQVLEFTSNGPLPARKIKSTAIVVAEGECEPLILMVMEDVTRQIMLEEGQKLARKQLYRSSHLASIGTLASGVAHEMNNPLTAVLGFTSALLGRVEEDGPIDREELGSYLQIIQQETIRCRDIVDHLHHFARERGEARITVMGLSVCVSNALRLLTARASRRGITITKDVPEALRVLADGSKLEEVLINILSNCIDFCGSAAAVTITAEPDRRSARFVRLEVGDTGPGIAADILPKAFDPFFTTKEVGEGIGLGLAICHKNMEELNGRIDIISEPGQGTVIVLLIPAAF